MDGLTTDLKPRYTKPRAAIFRNSEQVLTHLPQLMHLLGSRVMNGWSLSTLCILTSPINRPRSTWKSVAYFLRSQSKKAEQPHSRQREASFFICSSVKPVS